MFKPDLTKAQLLEIIQDMSEHDLSRFLYCQEMAGTYLAIGSFESTLILAMTMCDKVKIKKNLGQDEIDWKDILEKKDLFEGSTLGSLIKILQRHGIDENDIQYLLWIKGKRDYFIHRLFQEGAWPGDLDAESCRFLSRRLLAIQLWLSRAEHRIWFIFERADLIHVSKLSDGSVMAFNKGLFSLKDGVQQQPPLRKSTK